MKKYSWMVALFAIMAIAFGGFVSCGGGGGGGKVTIEFHANYGTFADSDDEIKSVEIYEGATVTAPTNVSLAAHNLAGWNTAANGTGQAWTSSLTHTQDTRYYAIWTPVGAENLEVKISIDVGGTIVPDILVTSSGTAAQRTVVPIEDVNGFQLIGVSGGHRAKYAWFELDLGAKRLGDFKAIEFDFEVVDCADDNRRLALIASVPAFPGTLDTHITGGSGHRPESLRGSDFGFLAAGQVTKPMVTALANPSTPTKVTLDIVPAFSFFDLPSFYAASTLANGNSTPAVPSVADVLADNALGVSVVRLSIYEHTAATADIKISNIKLIPWPEGVCTYCQEDNGDPCTVCNDAISTAKTMVENAVYTASQADVGSAAAARTAVQNIINGLSLDGVGATVIDGTFTAADTPTDGSYTFTVELRRGLGAMQTTAERTLTITAVTGEVVRWTLANYLAGSTSWPAFEHGTITSGSGQNDAPTLLPFNGWQRISSSVSGTRPVVTSSGTANTHALFIDRTTAPSNPRLLSINYDNNQQFSIIINGSADGIGLNTADNIYRIRIEGAIVTPIVDSSVPPVVTGYTDATANIQLNIDGLSIVGGASANFYISTEHTGAFSLDVELPETTANPLSSGNAARIRIQPRANAGPSYYRFDSIEIVYMGPRVD
jgi:hypothetical protein